MFRALAFPYTVGMLQKNGVDARADHLEKQTKVLVKDSCKYGESKLVVL
jgi:hypothetical protein